MMRVYVDGMHVKSKIAFNHVAYLAETFNILKTYSMKLNPLKCIFSVISRKVLGFIVN